MDRLDRRFVGGLVFLSAGNMWIVGGFIASENVATARLMFLFGLFLSIQGVWMVFKSFPKQGRGGLDGGEHRSDNSP